MNLSVILASYNTRDMTLDCLSSLFEQTENFEAEVWVVDNASSDESVQAIAAQFPQIHLIASESNLGFGVANNLAMSQANGEFYLLLNTDAFIHPKSLEKLSKYLHDNPSVGAVGPHLLNGDGTHQDSIHTQPTVGLSWLHALGMSRLVHRFSSQSTHETRSIKKNEYLKGACILLRREIWEKVGGFDEQFFFYGEDGDWCSRIKQAGFEVAYLHEAEVTHLSGKSSRHWIYSTLLNYSAQEYQVWKKQGTLGVINLHASWIVYSGRVWSQELLRFLTRRRRPDPAVITLCHYLIRMALARPNFKAPGFTTQIELPEGF